MNTEHACFLIAVPDVVKHTQHYSPFDSRNHRSEDFIRSLFCFGCLVICISRRRAISEMSSIILSISKGYFYHTNHTTEALTQGIDVNDVAVCLGQQITKNCSPNSKTVKVYLQRGHQATSLLASFPGRVWE